jgi:hypothetical protein
MPPPEPRRPVGVVLQEDRHAGCELVEPRNVRGKAETVHVEDVHLEVLHERAECAAARDGRSVVVRPHKVVVDAVAFEACGRRAGLDDRDARAAPGRRFCHVDQRGPVLEQLLRPASLRVEEETDLGDVWHSAIHSDLKGSTRADRAGE